MLEIKLQLAGLTEIVLHDHHEILRLLTPGCVVQSELLIFEQVTVVRKQHEALIQAERTLPVELEIADGVERISKLVRPFQRATDLGRLSLCQLIRDRHGLYRKFIGLMYVQIVIAGDAAKQGDSYAAAHQNVHYCSFHCHFVFN